MLGSRSGRAGIWVVIIILLLAAVGAGVLFSLTRQGPSVPAETPSPRERSPSDARASESWKAFVDDARAKCEQEPDCSVDYSALHDYDGKYFGVMIVGYKDSEYITDLYHYERESDEWVTAPKYRPENGYEVLDTAKASEQWGVPKETLDGWITSAEKAVQKVYERRASESDSSP